MIRYAALLFALVVVVLGLLGFIAPATFIDATQYFRAGNRIYVAAALRISFGVLLFAAATDSRWPRAMRIVAFVIVVFGLLTPVSTHPLPSVAWGWWPGDYVRPWAIATIAVGLFVIAAVVPPRRFDD
jgi:hypothetical protein